MSSAANGTNLRTPLLGTVDVSPRRHRHADVIRALRIHARHTAGRTDLAGMAFDLPYDSRIRRKIEPHRAVRHLVAVLQLVQPGGFQCRMVDATGERHGEAALLLNFGRRSVRE